MAPLFSSTLPIPTTTSAPPLSHHHIPTHTHHHPFSTPTHAPTPTTPPSYYAITDGLLPLLFVVAIFVIAFATACHICRQRLGRQQQAVTFENMTPPPLRRAYYAGGGSGAGMAPLKPGWNERQADVHRSQSLSSEKTLTGDRSPLSSKNFSLPTLPATAYAKSPLSRSPYASELDHQQAYADVKGIQPGDIVYTALPPRVSSRWQSPDGVAAPAPAAPGQPVWTGGIDMPCPVYRR